MFGDPLLRATLAVSCGLHLFVLLPAAYLGRQRPLSPAKNKSLGVTYVKRPQQERAAAKYPAAQPRPPSVRQEAFLRMPSGAVISGRQGAKQRQGMREEAFGPARAGAALKAPALDKPLLPKTSAIPLKKKISFPALDLNRVNSPTYVSYYQIVREKIKRTAYRNYTGKETGEVTLSFVISKDGDLGGLRLSEERSSPSPYLRQVALSSIKEALPFPNFPKDLDYPQLSFNLAITFELE